MRVTSSVSLPQSPPPSSGSRLGLRTEPSLAPRGIDQRVRVRSPAVYVVDALALRIDVALDVAPVWRLSDEGEGALTGRATGVPPPAHRWARHSHGMPNALRQMPRFAARAVASSGTKSCEYRR